MSKLTKFQAMLKCKCPRCRQGDMFTHRVYNLGKFRQMHERCPVCNLRFEKEPGFFWVSMFMSYALTVGMCSIIGVAIYILFNDPPVDFYLWVIIGFMVVISPVTFRASRVLMLYYLSGYKFDDTAGPRQH
jgi:uncharacterized protein (DUF983 family)